MHPRAASQVGGDFPIPENFPNSDAMDNDRTCTASLVVPHWQSRNRIQRRVSEETKLARESTERIGKGVPLLGGA